MAAAFYTAYAVHRLHIDLTQVGTFMGVMFSAQLIGALILGYITDIKGPWIIQIFTRLFESLSVGAVLLQPNIFGIYGAFGFLGLAQASMIISYHNMIIEMAPRHKVDTYVGLINSIRAPSLAVAPLIGGFLADSFSYEFIFIIALLSSLLSEWVLISKVKLVEK